MTLTDRQNHLLRGSFGLSMRTDAFNYAMDYLHTEDLSLHPDFLLIERTVQKKLLGTEDAARITSRASMRPSIARKHLIIIDGIDSMTEAAQNKLLKVLEDGNNVLIIAISYGGMVLDTIISRMSVTEYHILDRITFHEKLALAYPALNPDIYYPLTNGCMEAVSLLSDYDNLFCDLADCMQKETYPEMLQLFHMVKEKDELAVTENRTLIPFIISFIQKCFSEYITRNHTENMQDKLEILNHIESHRLRCKSPGYSKDDFFNLIMHIIEKSLYIKNTN